MKFIRKAFYYLIITIVLTGATAVTATLIYKNEIINLLVAEVNKKIKTKLEVDEIDLKLIKGFPNISIDFQGVKFYSAFEGELLLESKNIYFVLNVFELLNKNIVVERLEIIDAIINSHINHAGEKNFNVFVVSDSSKTSSKTLILKSVFFRNVEINDLDEVKKINDSYQITSLQGSLNIDEEALQLGVVSKLRLTKTTQKQLKWLINKKISLNLENSIIDNVITIHSSSVAIEEVILMAEGTIGIDGNRKIDLTLHTTNLKFKNLLSILPQAIHKRLTVYKGNGLINLSTKIKGNISGKSWPELKAQINLNKFEINHKALHAPLRDISLSGEIVIKNLNNLASGVLTIKKMSASIDSKTIEIAAKWQNFINPKIDGYVKGNLDIPWLLSFINSDNFKVTGAKGELKVDVSGSINLTDLFKVKNSDIKGHISFNNIAVDSLFGLPLSSLNGSVVFNNQEINLREVSGNYGKSNMLLNGYVVLPVESKKRLYSKLSVQSNFINLNEIVQVLTSSADTASTTNADEFKYSANFNMDIKRLSFLKFKGKDIKVNLTFDDKMLNVNTASAKSMGGEIGLVGSMSEQFNGDYYLKLTTQTKHINIDSLFYVFGNFKQTFITSEAIKGKLDANVYASMYFDSNWSFKRNLLYSEALLRVRKGELRNYQPVMSLSTYLNEEGENLAELKFSDLENHIIVSNDTVFISEMYVGTNVRNIKIGGYHTLNQHIDYRLAVPVISDNKDKDTQFGKVKSDKSGKLYFPFRVYGTTSDYKVVYDLKTASSNFIKGLGDVFVGRQKKNIPQDSLELDDDEFFDWDNN